MKNKLKNNISGFARFLLLGFFLLLVILPIYWMGITSLKRNSEIINTQEVTYFPKSITSENYEKIYQIELDIKNEIGALKPLSLF